MFEHLEMLSGTATGSSKYTPAEVGREDRQVSGGISRSYRSRSIAVVVVVTVVVGGNWKEGEGGQVSKRISSCNRSGSRSRRSSVSRGNRSCSEAAPAAAAAAAAHALVVLVSIIIIISISTIS